MPASTGHHKSPGPMHSQAQWRFLFAAGKPFARKWADQIVAERGKKTGYHSLPKNKPGNSTTRTRANKIRAALTHSN